MKDPMEGVSMKEDMSPEDRELMIKIRSMVDSNPDLLGNEDIMKCVKVALYRCSRNEPRDLIAKELDEELSGYLLKNKYNAPKEVVNLQKALKHFTEVL